VILTIKERENSMEFKKNLQNDAINPLLIAILNDEDFTLINQKPSISMLPGSWATRIMLSTEKPFQKKRPNRHKLVCRSCDHQDHYDMGKILINDEKWKSQISQLDESDKEAIYGLFLDCMSFTRYIRCNHCNEADGWNMDPYLLLEGFSKCLKEQSEDEDAPYRWGAMQLSDGELTRSATESEAYYISKLYDDPNNARLWYLLGSVYVNGDRPELGMVTFERSIELDRYQTEAYISAGFILTALEGMEAEAASYFHNALLSAHQYSHIQPLDLRDALKLTITGLIAVYEKSRKIISFFPSDKDYEVFFNNKEEYQRFDDYITKFGLVRVTSSNPSTLLKIAEIYMWHRADELPAEKRILTEEEKNGRVQLSTANHLIDPLRLPSGLGSEQRPIIIKVKSNDRAERVYNLCDQYGWKCIVGVERIENLTDLIKALREISKQTDPYAHCQCGSGKKYRFCCDKKFKKMSNEEIIAYYFDMKG
jgi:tetratricopeptide (TPR) repeat protein